MASRTTPIIIISWYGIVSFIIVSLKIIFVES